MDRWFAPVQRPMLCLVQMGQSPTQVHQPGLASSEALVDVVRTVQIFAIFVEP